MCAATGHVGLVIPWGHGSRRPTNTFIFENARCARCGELRWPVEKGEGPGS